MENRFLPPANINDFARSEGNEELLKKRWHDKMESIVEGLKNDTNDDGTLSFPRFYSPLDPVPEGQSVSKATIPWDGFPLMIENWLNLDENSSHAQWDQGFRSAENLRKVTYIYVQEVSNGQAKGRGGFELIPYDPANNLAMYPVHNRRVDTSAGFALLERIQDEYLEWHTQRDRTGRVTQISFTAEGPEYWETIAENDPKLLTDLYREYVDERVMTDDLYWQNQIACQHYEYDVDAETYRRIGFIVVFDAKTYNKFNKWNTRKGAMHLIQRNNSLAAEVRLAADATRRYGIRPDNTVDVNRFELVACGVPAGINRNSDPTISDKVNNLAISGLKVTISNPIGLYIGDVQVAGIRDANNQPVDRSAILKIERQNDDPFSPKILRFKIVLPEGSEEGLENYTLDGFPLAYGGPVAKQTSIVIYGEALPSDVDNPIIPCKGKPCYHPDKPDFIRVIPIGGDCAKVDWLATRPPFDVAEVVPELSIQDVIADVALKERPDNLFVTAQTRGKVV